MTVLHFAAYIVLLIFIAAIAYRIIKIMRTPLHLRWELYPVPHEKGPRAKYGGSRLEESEWWTKKLEKSSLGELKVMIPEIAFLKGVWEHNRKLWSGSYPFHLGLYVLIAAMFLLIISGILTASGSPVEPSQAGFNGVLFWIIYYAVLIGSAIGFLGAIRLFFARVVEKELALYSSFSHYFNIILIGAIYFTALLGLAQDSFFVENLTKFYAGLLSFSSIPEMSTVTYWHIWISLLFVLYLPFTHMTHFFMKYFTYHKVRWDDEPNVEGGKLRKSLEGQLKYKVTWSAPHIKADGNKTWLDLVASTGIEEEDKDEKK